MGGTAESKKDLHVLYCSYFETYMHLFMKGVKKLEHVRILSCNHVTLKDITWVLWFYGQAFHESELEKPVTEILCILNFQEDT